MICRKIFLYSKHIIYRYEPIFRLLMNLKFIFSFIRKILYYKNITFKKVIINTYNKKNCFVDKNLLICLVYFGKKSGYFCESLWCVLLNALLIVSKLCFGFWFLIQFSPIIVFLIKQKKSLKINPQLLFSKIKIFSMVLCYMYGK